MNNNQYTGFEVAVVGMSIRTSGASNWREFWENLALSKESLLFLGEDELISYGVPKSLMKDKNYVNCTTDLPNKDYFDSKFFGYSRDEAAMMYPGHRFFHECVWEALEDSGYVPDNIKESIGIYAGAGEDALWQSFVNFSKDKNKVNNFYLRKITNKDYLSTLVSYKLGLKGPSMNINTACSTSLVAIHAACKALIFGETKMALAGASSLAATNQKGYIYEEGSIISNDGHCRAFDKDSTGTVNGEGVGVVVLKRLKDALADNDNIYAIIKGSAVNNDGSNKVGYTAPSVDGQVACIKMAQKFSKVSPETISYVEAHGTGTKLGDSIEVEALNIAFNNDKSFTCPIGSVKTNIGHLDTASGVAGFIKTVLSLKNKKIPSSLHFKEADGYINFSGGPFFVNNKLTKWESRSNNYRRAAVNSFGVGGTNAHIILEEAPEREIREEEENFNLLILSAKTETALENYLSKLKHFLSTEDDLNLADMCYTYQTGRQHFDSRVSLVFNDKRELQELLEEKSSKSISLTGNKKTQNRIVFMFPGQGSQYVKMGRDLYLTNTLFREYMDKGFEFLKEVTDRDFKEILYPEKESPDFNINDTCFAQPIIFLIEYSIAKLVMDYGIIPDYMIGHSIGEYTAACISGLFSFEQTLKLVVKRGELMHKLPKGIMISVPISEQEAQNFLHLKVSVAAVNGPKQIVFSGDQSQMDKLQEELTARDISFVKLHTSHAFHSAMQDSILEEYEAEFQNINFNHIQIPFISNLTGEFIKKDEAELGKYWAQQLRNTVNFSKGINTILSYKNLFFIEVGAGNSLTSLIRQQKTENNFKSINLIRSAKNFENDEKYFLDKLGVLWCNGLNIKWQELHKDKKRFKTSLPTYAFDKIFYQTEVDFSKLFSGSSLVAKRNDLENSFYFPSWERSMLNKIEKTEKKIFLIFSDDSNVTDKIIERLISNDNLVIEVSIGKSFVKSSSVKFSIDPFSNEDYKLLFESLQLDNLIITDILYLWSLKFESSEFELTQENLHFGLVYFFPANIFKNWKQAANKNIFFFTNLLHKVIGNEDINQGQSLLLGLIKAAGIEKQAVVRNLDIEKGINNEKLIADILAEVLNEQQHPHQYIAYRFGQRWVQSFQKVYQDLAIEESSAIKVDGTYLITGGLGNMGFSISKYLIERYNANIVMLGRKSLIEIVQDHTYGKRLKDLKILGKNVVYLQADICDPDAVKSLRQRISDPISGIIHLAGNVSSSDLELVENTSFTKTVNMLSPKLIGIKLLYENFKNADLDFFWMSSSLAATFGGISFGAYASANSYLDYFAFDKSGIFKCVQLPQINFDDKILDISNNILSKQELISVFEKSINIKHADVIYISKEDITSKMHLIFSSTALGIKEDKEIKKSERPELQTVYQEPQNDTEAKLKLIFEDFFEISGIGVTDDFFELGGDSLRAMVFLKIVNKEFNIEISILDFFSYKNIKGMAGLIDEKKWLSNTSAIDLKNEIII